MQVQRAMLSNRVKESNIAGGLVGPAPESGRPMIFATTSCDEDILWAILKLNSETPSTSYSIAVTAELSLIFRVKGYLPPDRCCLKGNL